VSLIQPVESIYFSVFHGILLSLRVPGIEHDKEYTLFYLFRREAASFNNGMQVTAYSVRYAPASSRT